MDSAPKTLIAIATVSQRVVSTLDRYIGHKTVKSLQLDKIVVGSRTVLEALNKTLLLKDDNSDDQLVDWLNSEAPQACLRTLNQMEEILNRKPEYLYGVKSLFNASRSTNIQDKNNKAIRLFQTCEGYFHFLVTTDIRNGESGLRLTTRPDVLHINQVLGGSGLQSKSGDPSCVAQARKIPMMKRKKQGVNLDRLDSILGWLSACDSRSTHERTILLRQPDTCAWLPNTHQFKTWRKSAENSFLWLHGKAGAGKSVLAASVIEGLNSTLQDGEVLVYFYCDFKNEQSTSAVEVIRCLLSQLLQQFHQMVHPGDLIEELIKEMEGTSTTRNVLLLGRHVSRVAKQFLQQPFLVIDALDECKDIDLLLNALVELRKGGTRILVTSRPIQVIKDVFSGLPSISMDAMQDTVSADIELHARRELDSHPRLRNVDTELKDEIYSILPKRADGMFRWVECQLDIFKECPNTARVRDVLSHLPIDLNAVYERILLKIDEGGKGREGEIARRALDYLVVALQPLRLSQIVDGLSIDLQRRGLDPGSRSGFQPVLLELLGSLVTHDEVTDIITLSHFSVMEHLIGKTSHAPAHYIDQQSAHTQLALLCTYYITAHLKQSKQWEDSEDSPRDTYTTKICQVKSDVATSHTTSHLRPLLPSFTSAPFLEYVLSRGFHHLAHVDPRDCVVLQAIVDLQLNAQQHASEWERLCNSAHSLNVIWPTLKHDLVLYILIAFAPEPLLCSFLSHATLQLKDGTNPLTYAAHFGKTEHARTLLSRGVGLGRRGWHPRDHRMVLPLEVAIERGDCAMVDLFLAKGSPVPHELFVSALKKEYCRIPVRIVWRLLQTDDFVEWAGSTQDEDLLLRSLDPMRYSYSESSEQISMGLQVSPDPTAQYNNTSFHHSMTAQHASAVKHTHSPSCRNIVFDGSCSHSAMIRLFLSMGSRVDIVSPVGNTVLHLVLNSHLSEDDCWKSVQVLINAGCNPSTCNSDGETPLHLAVRNGYIFLAKYLLSLPDVPLPSNILLAASESHTAEMIYLLIDKGANVHAIAADGNTPLHGVLCQCTLGVDSGESLLECTKVLIDTGCNPCQPNALGQTPFHVAAKHGHLPVIQYLLSLNVPLPSRVLLPVASSRSSKAIPIMKLLVDKGADVHDVCPGGDTLLHLSLMVPWEEECLRRIRVFFNAGCDPRACNQAGETPFHVAAGKGYISVMKYLLSLGISVPSDVMLTQLQRIHWPAPSSCYPAIHFLLENGGDIHTISENGDTLLHLAATLDPGWNALEIAKFLVHAGCNPCILNSAHETPLHVAARCGYVAFIDYLLSPNISPDLPSDILLAASMGYSKKAQVMRYLIGKGANASAVTTNGDTALHLLLVSGEEYDQLECLEILIHAGCNPHISNLAGETPLHVAAMCGCVSALQYLLSQGVPLPHDILLSSTSRMMHFFLSELEGIDTRSIAATNDVGQIRRTLDTTREEDSLEHAKIIVGLADWDPSSRKSAGETPIHIAARYGHISTIKYLLSQKVPLPSDILLAAVPSDKGRYTDRTVPLIHFLIHEGAIVNTANSNGDTPLHLALHSMSSLDEHDNSAQRWSWALVEMLLRCGPDPSARNADRQTPFDIAEANGEFFRENFLRILRGSLRI